MLHAIQSAIFCHLTLVPLGSPSRLGSSFQVRYANLALKTVSGLPPEACQAYLGPATSAPPGQRHGRHGPHPRPPRHPALPLRLPPAVPLWLQLQLRVELWQGEGHPDGLLWHLPLRPVSHGTWSVCTLRFGYRTYTRCREAHLRAQDQCRDRGRGRDYGNTYNRCAS